MESMYKVETKTFRELNGFVNVPRYQRKLVWSQSQKNNFIDNVAEGYPFGSILLYRYDFDEKYSIIDGLQRFTTLQDYASNKAKYVRYEEFTARCITILKDSFEGETPESTLDDWEQKINKILKDCLEENDPDVFYLSERFSEEFSFLTREGENSLTRLQKSLTDYAEKYLDVNSIPLPCVIFIGDESNLPEVFANLNQGGTKLSKYQVLAAHWHTKDFVLPTGEYADDILEKVIARYERLSDSRALEIEGFDRDVMESSRKINLSEFCYALGEKILEIAPIFASQSSNESEDSINQSGYLSVAIALSVDNRKLGNLAKKIDWFKNEQALNALIKNIIDEYKTLQSTLGKWISRPGSNGNPKYESSAIASLQALSFFATLWHSKYTVNFENPGIEKAPGYRVRYEQIRKNLVSYCVMDIARGTWSGTGDSKLARFYQGENRDSYIKIPDETTIFNKLSLWLEESTNKGSINQERVSKLLLCILAAKDSTKYTGGSYD